MNLSEYDTSKIPLPEEFPKLFLPYFENKKQVAVECSPYRMRLQPPYDMGGKYDKKSLRTFTALDKYQDQFTALLRENDDFLFSNGLKYLWLKSKFRHGSVEETRTALGIFIKGYIGAEQKIYFGKGMTLALLEIFAAKLYGEKEFYKNSDPLATPPLQPFRNLFLGHYAAVREMDEALSLLRYADDHKMKLNGFLDYLVNYVAAYNARYGDKYLMLSGKSGFRGAVIKLEGGTEFSTRWLGKSGNKEKINEKYGGKPGTKPK